MNSEEGGKESLPRKVKILTNKSEKCYQKWKAFSTIVNEILVLDLSHQKWDHTALSTHPALREEDSVQLLPSPHPFYTPKTALD